MHACQSSNSLGTKQDSSSKITRPKRTDGMAQRVEHLPNKYEALSQTPYNQKKKNYKNCVLSIIWK
jgi:hypothetical protein